MAEKKEECKHEGTNHGEVCKKCNKQVLTIDISAKKEKCSHEWRAIENFYQEISKYERIYATYCVHCRLLSNTKLIKLSK